MTLLIKVHGLIGLVFPVAQALDVAILIPEHAISAGDGQPVTCFPVEGLDRRIQFLKMSRHVINGADQYRRKFVAADSVAVAIGEGLFNTTRGADDQLERKWIV